MLREIYTNPKLFLYTPTKRLICVVNRPMDIERVKHMNDSWELSFKVLKKEYLDYDPQKEESFEFNGIQFKNGCISQDSCEMLIRLNSESDYYIIREIGVSSSDKTILNVKCYREEESLKKIMTEPLKLIGQTPQALFEGIKSATRTCTLNYYWLGTDADPTALRSLITQDEQSVFDNLLELSKLWNGWLEFTTDSNNNRYVFLRVNAIKAGRYYIKKGTGYRDLDLTFDTKNIVTRMYAYGSKNLVDDRDINIMGVNPTGKSYIEDFSLYKEYYKMTDDEIANTPQCHQEATFRDSNIADATVLYNTALEELQKKNKPVITGSLTYENIYVYEENIDPNSIRLDIGYEVVVLNVDLDYSFKVMVSDITERFGKEIMKTPLSITNITPYSNPLKDIVSTLRTVDRVTDTGVTGEPYISDTTVKDNNGETVKTKIKNAVARIEEGERQISIIVGEVSDHESRIDVLEDEIVLRVTKEQMWSEIALNPGKILMAVNDEENHTDVTIEPELGLGVHNGKITIYNEDDEIAMQGNTKGSLSIREGFEITDFEGRTFTEYNKDGINFYRSGRPLIGFQVNDDELEFMGLAKFNNTLDVYDLTIQGQSLEDYIKDIVHSS